MMDSRTLRLVLGGLKSYFPTLHASEKGASGRPTAPYCYSVWMRHLSIITKSGTNDVKGSAFGFFRDDALRAQGALDAQKNNYSRQQYGGTAGGPIVRNKTHFFGSVEHGSCA